MLHIEPAGTPAHLRLVHAPDLAARPLRSKAIGRCLHIRVAVEEIERIAQEDEVEVDNEDRETHEQRLPQQAILERANHIGAS